MEKVLTQKRLVYAGLAIFFVVLFYLIRSVLTPFILAAAMSYVLNPAINWIDLKLKLPRGLSIGIIYIVLILVTIFTVSILGSRLFHESEQIQMSTKTVMVDLRSEVNYLPDWSQDVANDVLDTINANVQISPRRIVPMFSGALGKTVNVLIFFLATFYFIKDGSKIMKRVLESVNKSYRDDLNELLKRVNGVLGDYLRGQLILVLIMSLFTYLTLSIIGVPYALALAVFTGFAEIIPFIGPVIAAGAAVFVASTDTTLNFGLTPITEILVVIIIYTILRQAEDLFVIPQVMGKLTKLHPLVVLVSVLAGAHLFGPIGLVIAVPLAATGRVVIIYFLEKVG